MTFNQEFVTLTIENIFKKSEVFRMIRLTGRELQTSFVQFEHVIGHKIGFLSCIHLGTDTYLETHQKIIDTWRGVVFEETVTGDANLIKQIPKEKAGIQFDWQTLFELQRMKSQRLTLVYPPDSSRSSDISFKEVLGLYNFVTIKLLFSDDDQKKALNALKKNPGAANTILWYLMILLFRGVSAYPELISYEDLRAGFKAPFFKLREKVNSIFLRSPDARSLYGILEYLYLYEPETNFLPERDTSVLRNIDLERAGDQRDILIVYGAGHYFGITRGLYDRGYNKKYVTWSTVCELPEITECNFVDALTTIAKSM